MFLSPLHLKQDQLIEFLGTDILSHMNNKNKYIQETEDPYQLHPFITRTNAKDDRNTSKFNHFLPLNK